MQEARVVKNAICVLTAEAPVVYGSVHDSYTAQLVADAALVDASISAVPDFKAAPVLHAASVKVATLNLPVSHSRPSEDAVPPVVVSLQ